jgi:hypothetical protein
MVEEKSFTIDDAFISFRYARNLADGLGLVFNAGERIEGYTNFLWTLIAAAVLKLGGDPVWMAKFLGGASALGSLTLVYFLSQRLRPFAWVPCIATWLLASTIVFSGFAVYGLETAFFLFLILLGIYLMSEETPKPEAFPWSAVAFSLAALTRPEAPMYAGLAMLCLGRRFLNRQNLIRGGLFTATLVIYLLWRHSYYGAWVPNTFTAKTGNWSAQIGRGINYFSGYFELCGAILWASVYGIALSLWSLRKPSSVAPPALVSDPWLGLALSVELAAVMIYVTVIGGDWMPCFRFMSTFEPLCFLLVDLGVRTLAAQANGPGLLALGVVFGQSAFHRFSTMRSSENQMRVEKGHWDDNAGAASRWFLQNNQPGTIALGDIGLVGYTTNYPILDILGLVDPVIANLPGGYTTKQGPEYVDYFFQRMPEYFVAISSQNDCDHPYHPAISAIYNDPKRRFKANYEVSAKLPLGSGISWCIYQRRKQSVGLNRRLLFNFENGMSGWEISGDAFANGPTTANNPGQGPILNVEGKRVANSFHPQLGDRATGTAISPPFLIDHDFMGLLVGGGNKTTTRVELVVDGRVHYTRTGDGNETLQSVVWDVRPLRGLTGRLVFTDEETGPGGHLLVDQVEMFDQGSD